MTHRFVALAAALHAFVLPPAIAGAQTAEKAPAGNAHPHPDALAHNEGSNPFGAAPGESGFDIAEKAAFARQVDLAPLRDLAVFHGGRIKILDTLARESVRGITGRRDYQDFIKTPPTPALAPGSGGGKLKVEKIDYDPLFTLLDMMIDPAYYADKPLIHVEYLPVREAFLDEVFTNPQEHERWKRLGRLRPADVDRFASTVMQQPPLSAQKQRSIDNILSAMQLYRDGWHNLLMVTPDSADEPWAHLSSLPADSAALAAARGLAAAWRHGDAAGVNAAAATLAAELPAIHPEFYPTTRRHLEAIYNAAHPFVWGYWLYALSFLLLLLAFGTHARPMVVGGVVVLFLAIAMHALGFPARSYIAERYAIQNQFESMTGVSLGAALIGCIAMLIRRQWLFGAAAAGVGFMMLVTASTTGIPGESIEREAAILNTSVLLKYHVTTVLMSYGMIALAFIISLFYLATHYATRGSRAKLAVAGGGAGANVDSAALEASAGALGLDDDAPAGPARILSDLDKAQMIIIQLAFWGLGVGILLGAWWADHSWGRWWGFDPKELWALITWIVYLVVIHVRFTSGANRGLVTAWLSVAGFFIMLWTYFGVNLLLPGLHAYA
jgi:cytochrome c-type biogenesis protein CcsB